MIVYIVSLLLSLFFSFFAYNKKEPLKKKTLEQKIFCVLSAIPLMFVSTFRYGVGNDYFGYVEYFRMVKRSNYMEYGFNLILLAIRFFTDNFVWMFAVCSLIFFYFIFKGIYEQSINPTLSIFLLVCAPYYFEFFSGMRQMIAVAIFFYSIKYIKTRGMLQYLVLNIIGGLIHTSAFLFLPIYFIYHFKLTPKKAFFAFVIVLASKEFLKRYLYNFISFTKYNNYIDNNMHFGIVTLIVPLFIFIFSMLYYRKNDKNDINREYQIYCNLMFFQVIIVMLQDFGTYFTRIGWGFGISQIVLIPLSISRINNEKNRIYITILICVLFIIYVIINRFTGPNTLLPFKWVFNI